MRVALGRVLAFQLQAGPGDTVNMLLVRSSADGALAPRIGAFEVAGLFEIGLAGPRRDARLRFARGRRVARGSAATAGIRVFDADPFEAAYARQRSWPRSARRAAPTGRQEHAAYFRAIRLEKTMMTVILMLIVAVAAFNIVASLVMVVNEKRNDIAILRTLGISRGGVVATFIVQGRVIGWFGALRAPGSGSCSRCMRGTSSTRSSACSASSSSTRPCTTSPASLRRCGPRTSRSCRSRPSAHGARDDLPGAARGATEPAERLRYE